MARAQCPPCFDFVEGEAPGPLARLKDAGSGQVVVLAEWPASLLDMYRAGVLVGQAGQVAEGLAREPKLDW